MSDTESINKKDSLDSLVLEAKHIIRLANEHAQVCESFRKSLEDNGIGPTTEPTPSNNTTQRRVSITMIDNESDKIKFSSVRECGL